MLRDRAEGPIPNISRLDRDKFLYENLMSTFLSVSTVCGLHESSGLSQIQANSYFFFISVFMDGGTAEHIIFIAVAC